LTWLHSERWAVDAFAVYENVTVNDHLTGLGDGASETGTKHKCIETHLKKLN
jgi:hypothetical protein